MLWLAIHLWGHNIHRHRAKCLDSLKKTQNKTNKTPNTNALLKLFLKKALATLLYMDYAAVSQNNLQSSYKTEAQRATLSVFQTIKQ